MFSCVKLETPSQYDPTNTTPEDLDEFESTLSKVVFTKVKGLWL